MSKRRRPGEIVKRQAGSGFCGSAKPELIRVPKEPVFTDEMDPCMICEDKECREWANLEIVSGDYAGEYMYHISECQMSDS